MQTKTLTPPVEMLTVSKADVVAAWAALEKLVGSLRRIGGHYATPDGQTLLSPEQRLAMLESLGTFFDADVWKELSHARRALAQYVPDEEAEDLSDNVIQYWTPPV